MGTFRLNAEDIADILEEFEENGKFDGDFSEKDFILGAKLFMKRLKKRGAYFPK